MNDAGEIEGLEDLDMAISRRSALERLAVLTGITLSSSISGFLASGCGGSFGDVDNWEPQTLSPEDVDLVAAIAERIIPETDTPGARGALVHRFIDLMLTDWYPAIERDHFTAELDRFRAEAIGQYQQEFIACTHEEQDHLLEVLEASELAMQESANPPELPGFFRMMKQLTLVGYYTSEAGATRELRYLAVPAKYDGCVSVDEIGRTWA